MGWFDTINQFSRNANGLTASEDTLDALGLGNNPLSNAVTSQTQAGDIIGALPSKYTPEGKKREEDARIQAEAIASFNTNNPGLINPNLPGGASQAMADITKATYNDWKSTYLPIALEAMNQTTYKNPALLKGAIGEAKLGAENTFNNTAGIRNRTASRYGVSFDEQQTAANNRTVGLEKSRAVVDAANRIRQRLADRDRQVATGGVPNLAGKAYGIE